MKILIYILILFSLQAEAQQTIFKLSKFARIKFSHSLPAPPEDTEDPTTPTLSFVTKTATTISVSWTTSTDNVGVTGYDIYLDAVLYDNEIGTSIVVSGLTQNTEYDIYVVAKDAAGNESANSNTVTQTTNDGQAPTAPTLAFVSKTTTSISVSWSGATDNVAVTSYDVYKDGAFYTNETGTTSNIIGLSPNTEYDIHVKARDAANNQSVNSNTITETTDAEAAASAGAEIFRMVTTNPSGWEWREDSTDVTWEAMQLWNGTGIANITDNGGTYRGYVFTNEGSTNNGHPMQISGDNVTIEYCIFRRSRNVGIRGNGANNLLVQKCLFNDLGIGMWISFSTNFKALNNQFLNMKYHRADPANGSARSGQSVFTEGVTGAGNRIDDNRIENNFGESYNEDHINTYASAGTAADSFFARRNYLRGGSGSYTGGGMIIGDAGANRIHFSNNRLVNPGWYGFQIYSGVNSSLVYNYLYSDFTLPTQLPWNRVGFLIYNCGGTCTGMVLNTTNVSRYRKGSHGGDWNGAIYNIEDGAGYGCGCSPGGFNVTASTTLTPANMPMPDGSTGFPDHLINYVSVDDYWKLRSGTFLDTELLSSHTTLPGSVGAPVNQNAPNVNARRPTASVAEGATINITTTSTTLTNSSSISTGGPGTFTLSAHSWTHVSGPNTPTIVDPTGTSTSVTGLAHGTHVFRYVVEQNNSTYNLKTYQVYWVTVNVDLS